MKLKSAITLIVCLLAGVSSFAQQKDKMTREEKDEKTQARATRVNAKNDYAVFHRLILGLKEYQDERKKMPALQKANKSVVKVTAVVDSLEDDDNKPVLTGAIRQDIGDNTMNLYELTFDRKTKKIVGVKHTPEAIDAEKEEAAEKEEKTTTTTTVKSKEKTVTPKKKKDDDDDDAEEPEDKPVKGKKPKTNDED